MSVIQSKARTTLKGWWDFRAGHAADLTGNNDGAFNGDPAFTSSGIDLDGSGDYLDMGDPDVLDFGTGDFTIVCLIKTAVAAAADVVSKRNGVTNTIGWICGTNAGGNAFYEIDDGAGNEILQASSVVVADGAWHSMAFVFDRSGNGSIYVDGVFNASNNISSVGTITNAVNFLVGRNADGTRQYPGGVGVVLAFSELLTDTEVAQLGVELKETKWPLKPTGKSFAGRNTSPYSVDVNTLVDGDMEASGVDDWTATNNAALSKQTGTPQEGLQVLRVAYDGTANPQATQNILAKGQRYQMTGWARSDGTYVPSVWPGGGATWTGTTETKWQYFNVIGEANGALFRLATNASGAGYCEFDNVMLAKVTSPVAQWEMRPSGAKLFDIALNHHASIFGNPVYGEDTNGRFAQLNGTNDYFEANDSASLSFTDGSNVDQPFTFACWVNMKDATNFNILNKLATSEVDGEWSFGTDGSDKIYCLCIDKSAAASAGKITDAAVTSLETKWAYITVTYDGTGDPDGLTEMNIYINGVGQSVSATGTDPGNYVGMENGTDKVRIGRLLTNYADGAVMEPKIWDRELSAAEVQAEFSRANRGIGFKGDWGATATSSSVTSGQLSNTPFQVSSGTWDISTDTINGQVVKVLECSVAGVCYLPADLFQPKGSAAYGDWRFWMYKGADANNTSMQFVANVIGAPDAGGQSGYELRFDATEAVLLRESTAGTPTTLWATAASYIANSTWYALRPVRRFDGQFTSYIQGGAYAKGWTLISTAGGSGTNPVIDTSTTSSQYIVLDFDAGDKFAYANLTGDNSLITSDAINLSVGST